MTIHIMVDLETWGTTPGSDIRSIGAVVFDPVTGTLGSELHIATMGGGRFGLRRDPSTVTWWSQQSAEAQAAFASPVPIEMALDTFAEWWRNLATVAGCEPTFWAKGPHFDEVILAECYRSTGRAVPWHYRSPRDVRTIEEAAEVEHLAFEGEPHNALDDAKHQARTVIEGYRRLGIGGPQTSEEIADNIAAATIAIKSLGYDHEHIMRRAQQKVRDLTCVGLNPCDGLAQAKARGAADWSAS